MYLRFTFTTEHRLVQKNDVFMQMFIRKLPKYRFLLISEKFQNT